VPSELPALRSPSELKRVPRRQRAAARSGAVARPALIAAIQTRATTFRIIPEPDTRVTATGGVMITAAMAATTTVTAQESLAHAATTAPRAARRAGTPLTVAEQLNKRQPRARPLQIEGAGLF